MKWASRTREGHIDQVWEMRQIEIAINQMINADTQSKPFYSIGNTMLLPPHVPGYSSGGNSETWLP